MANCLVKSIILYIVIMTMIFIIKPQMFYYDVEKTKLKPWNLYKETGSIEDTATVHTASIIIGVIVFMIVNNL